MNRSTILLIGANGYLGKFIYQALVRQSYKVLVIGRATSNYRIDGYFDTAGNLVTYEEIQPDLIINLANSYVIDPSTSEIQKMRESIIDLSNYITDYAVTNRVRVILTSSYFQYAPSDLQPWSEYAEMKRIATSHAKFSLIENGIPFLELVLYDNFGGPPRGKILDLLLDAFRNSGRISVNPGESLINLIHIEDLVQAYLIGVRSILESKCIDSSFSLHGDETLTIRQLVECIEKSSGSNIKMDIAWGEKAYRNREMMQYWQPYPRLPKFEPRIKLVDYLGSVLNQD
jgi:CDP-3, 6-dideoxy-D-glycero-L-glycero-4-hexulose-4-reductase